MFIYKINKHLIKKRKERSFGGSSVLTSALWMFYIWFQIIQETKDDCSVLGNYIDEVNNHTLHYLNLDDNITLHNMFNYGNTCNN